MNHYRDEIRIDTPVEHVWELLCDFSRWHDWAPRAEISDWSGPYDQVGTTYVSKQKMMGHELKTTQTVVEVEPLKLIREHTDQGPMDSFWRLERDGEATRLIVESDYELPAHIPGFIKNLLTKNWVDRNMRHMLEEFKAQAELKVPQVTA